MKIITENKKQGEEIENRLEESLKCTRHSSMENLKPDREYFITLTLTAVINSWFLCSITQITCMWIWSQVCFLYFTLQSLMIQSNLQGLVLMYQRRFKKWWVYNSYYDISSCRIGSLVHVCFLTLLSLLENTTHSFLLLKSSATVSTSPWPWKKEEWKSSSRSDETEFLSCT